MDFLSWLDQYTLKENLWNSVGKTGGEVELRDENDDVKIRIKNVHSAVVGLPTQMGQWRIISEGGWYKTSDFIVFGEHPAQGSYVFLIEFKRTPRDLEDIGNVENDSGREELRWNVSIFHYLFSLFRTATIEQGSHPSFVVRRFLIGNEYSRKLNGRFQKGRVKGTVFDYEKYEGVWINLLATHGDLFPLQVIDMISKSK
ncbi:MAG: hypothetical protein OXL39_02930 [Caldilineaceae bacterium]|nr:hypothetical protein [Caldilineaceae bacterium]